MVPVIASINAFRVADSEINAANNTENRAGENRCEVCRESVKGGSLCDAFLLLRVLRPQNRD
jgi:hypothetical protein